MLKNDNFFSDMKLLLAVFTISKEENGWDCRPYVKPKLPFWLVKETYSTYIIVSYTYSIASIKRLWKEPYKIVTFEVDEIVFTDKFPCPSWYMHDEGKPIPSKREVFGLGKFFKERRARLEPQRMKIAKRELSKLGYDVVECNGGKYLTFMYKGSNVSYYPYSGWATGKSIHDCRGLRNLILQINKWNL